MHLPGLSTFRSTAQFLLSPRARGVFDVAHFSQSNYFPATFSVSQALFKRWKSEDRKFLIQSTPLKDMGTQGEKQLDVDLVKISTENVYPDADTSNLLFDGVKFSNLPICHIKTSKNNTIMDITTADGDRLAFRSCGLEGFKNTRKGTNIAAQTTAVTISGMAKKKGVTHVRVKIQGLGPGRMSAVKGLQMAGINIVSVTDCTPISWNPPRPRKARRL